MKILSTLLVYELYAVSKQLHLFLWTVDYFHSLHNVSVVISAAFGISQSLSTVVEICKKKQWQTHTFWLCCFEIHIKTVLFSCCNLVYLIMQ